MKSAAAPAKRAYRQGARARATEETADRILDAFAARLQHHWFDEITLDQIARDAGVTTPTIVRRFGSKEKLLHATWQRMAVTFTERRRVAVGDVPAAVRVIVAAYERDGDLVMRALAQEDRYPAFKPVNDIGRGQHRAWVEATFAPWLDGLSRADRLRRVDAIIAALDLYIWRLVRRDMGRSVRHVQGVMHALVCGAIGEPIPDRLKEDDND